MKLHQKLERWLDKRLNSKHLEWHPLVGDYIQLPTGSAVEIEANIVVKCPITGSANLFVEFSINGKTCSWAARTLRIVKELPNNIRLWHKLFIAEYILYAAVMSPSESDYLGVTPSLNILVNLQRIDQYLRYYYDDTTANLVAQSLLSLEEISPRAIIQAIEQLAEISLGVFTTKRLACSDLFFRQNEGKNINEQIKQKYLIYLQTQPNWVAAYKDVEVQI